MVLWTLVLSLISRMFNVDLRKKSLIAEGWTSMKESKMFTTIFFIMFAMSTMTVFSIHQTAKRNDRIAELEDRILDSTAKMDDVVDQVVNSHISTPRNDELRYSLPDLDTGDERPPDNREDNKEKAILLRTYTEDKLKRLEI